MKKLLLISLLTLGFFSYHVFAMEEREDGTRKQSSSSNNATMYEEETKEQDSLIYKIVCKNDELEIDKEQFENLKKISHTIAHLMQDINDTTTLESNIIPLQQLESNVVQEILALIDTMPQEQTAEYTKFIEQLSQQSLDNLISLLSAANYLDIQSVLDLLSTAIAHKTVQEAEAHPSFFDRILSRNLTPSERILTWFHQNKDRFDLAPEFLNRIAIKIIEAHPSIKNIIFPVKPDYVSYYNKRNSYVSKKSDLLVRTSVWNPDRSVLALGGYGYNDTGENLWLWTQNTDHNIWTFTPHNTAAPIHCLDWSPDGTTLATAHDNASINLWTQTDNTWKISNTLHNDAAKVAFCVAWSPDGNTLAAGYDNNIIRLWIKDADNWTATDLPIQNYRAIRLSWSPDGTTLTAGHATGNISLWTQDSDKNWNPTTLTGHTESISAFKWNPDGTILASTSFDKIIRLWKKDPNYNSWISILAENSSVSCLEWSPDGNILATIARPNRKYIIHLWRKDSDIHWIPFTLIKNPNNIFITWEPNGNLRALLLGSKKYTIRRWGKFLYKNVSIAQAFLLLAWNKSKLSNTPFTIPAELQEAFEEFPENLQNFLTNKEQ